MKSSHMCPTCHRLIDSSLQYCPYCRNPVDPTLLAKLGWMYQTILDLDRRIAQGEGAVTVQTLRDEMTTEYLQLRTSAEKAAVPDGNTTETAAPPAAPPGVPGRRHSFSWSAFFADQSIAILAYTGAFLLLVATLSFEVGGWKVLTGGAKLGIVIAVYALFGIAGLALLPRRRMRTISQTYLGIFALMTPLVGLAAYQYAISDTGFSVAGMVSVTAWYTTLVYLGLALRTRYQQYSYMSWIVAILAAESILAWASISSNWAPVVLAVMAIALLAPLALGLPPFLARPALLVSLVVSIVVVMILELIGLGVASQSLYPSTGVQPIQHAFTVTTVTVTILGVSWSLMARRRGWSATQFLDVAVLALGVQTAVAIGGDLNISRIQMGDLFGILALPLAATAIAYRRFAVDRWITRWGAWGLSLSLPVIGWLLNTNLADPNQPLIVCLVIGSAVSSAVAVSERSEWWVVYGGIALSIVFHSVVDGLAVNSGQEVFSTANSVLNAWWQVGFTVALWVLSTSLASFPVARRFSRPGYAVAVINGLFAAALIISVPTAASVSGPTHAYGSLSDGIALLEKTLVLTAFTALALVTGLRERELRRASQIGVGIFGSLALVPYLITSDASGSYWQWFAPPVIAAVIALSVRRALGRGFAIPLYIVALGGALVGQLRLFSDTTASTAGVLGWSAAVWFPVILGVLSVLVAVLEGQWWVTLIAAYCGLISIIATPLQISGYLLVLLVVIGSVALRAWRGRWWNICLLSASVIMAMVVVGRFGEDDARTYALNLSFLAIMALVGYAAVVVDRGNPETVIAASLLIFLPMFTQSLTSSLPAIFTSVLAFEALVMTVLGVGMQARGQLYIGSGFVALAAVRGAVLAYSSGVPIALIIAGLALFLLAVATWLSVQARAFATPGQGSSDS